MTLETVHHIRKLIPSGCLLAVFLLSAGVSAGETAVEVRETSEKTVNTDIHTQESMESWLEEERRLLEEIEEVQGQLKHTAWQREKTAKYHETLERKVADLNRRAEEMEKISQELLLVLDETLKKLQVHVKNSLPFNREERDNVLKLTGRVLNDYDMGLLVKTRTVFDAVAREVDMGYGVDVRDIEISVDGRPRQVKVFRVGRVGLFALAMDTQSAYVWDEAKGKWLVRDRGGREIEEAIEMAEGTRIIGLSRLPVGQPVKKGGAGGETDG